VTNAQIPEEVKNALQKASRDGAKAKVTFRVTDSQGHPVTNADVRAGFAMMNKADNIVEGKTDTNGLFVAEGLCSGDANFHFTKEGHYQTSLRHWFASYDPNVLKDGKWQPWNPTIEITLKEKRNPIPMYVKRTKVFLPKKDEPFGFDCKMNDLVEPYGKGKEADFTLMYSSDFTGLTEHRYTNQIVFATVNQEEGFIQEESDTWSPFRSLYDAPVDGYQTEMVFYCKSQNPRTREEVNFGRDMYVIFRSRVELDDEGNIISAHYGKIYPTFDYGEAPKDKGEGRVEFCYYLNPTENDTNLEYNMKDNLLNPRDPHYAP